ncbi:MAG: nucleoside transporter C-terminal domain-containing protein [Planctomycetota bacterium]|nr:nucleoside transporter C-terminal domain-containing protein [Planctomycetota bacterium]
MTILRAALGLAFFCGIAWLMSSNRRRFPTRVVLFGLGLQVALAWLILGTDTGRGIFDDAASLVSHLIAMAQPGAEMVFGPLANPAKMSEVFGKGNGFILSMAGSGLVVIIFFSALMSLLYHMGIMQVLIWLLAKIMSATMGVSGAESMAMAANMFVGQTEAPLVVRPYIAGMTKSELNALMTGGFATIAGSVMAVYIGILGPEYGPHLLTASVMSAPAAFLIAKIMQPETEVSTTAGNVELRIERTASNAIEAAANGTSDGLKLWLNVIAMLIAFVALVACINWPLGALGEWLVRNGGMDEGTTLSLQSIFGWVFAPVAWVMGVEGWADCQRFGSLLGTKIAVNEFVAFSEMVSMLSEHGQAAFQHERSKKMAAYALCGFANFASIGIQIGGISPLAPERKKDISALAFRAMLGGAFASWMTATVAGAFLTD